MMNSPRQNYLRLISSGLLLIDQYEIIMNRVRSLIYSRKIQYEVCEEVVELPGDYET